MHLSRKVALALVSAALVAGSAIGAAGAVAAPVTPVLTTSLAPSVPTDPVLHGVAPGSAPWVLKRSAATLSNGVLVATIQGLVIPELGTPGPVTSVDVALYCANETTPAATTKTFPLSEKGNAQIVEKVNLPATCLTPALLINPLGIGSIYIGTSGFAANQSEPLGQSLLVSSLAPSVPTDPVLHGVAPGSAPWVIRQSTASLTDGLLVVDVDGLIIPELGTPGPVKSIDAALYCANETTPAAMTGTFPLSEQGNALIVEKVKLPSTCLTPALLINPLGIGSIYIATSGFAS
jgi:hypothetical protein